MLRFLFGWQGQQATFKPYKAHACSKRQHLSGLPFLLNFSQEIFIYCKSSDYSCQTLGLGDLKGAVKLPEGEKLEDWIATNTVDFYNELSIIWGEPR